MILRENVNLKAKELILLNNKNPYCKDVIEYKLIQFIIDKVSLLKNIDYWNINYEIIDYVKDCDIQFDEYSTEKLWDYAINLALIHRIVEIRDISLYSKSNTKKFGLFFEDGLEDVLNNNNYFNPLITEQEVDTKYLIQAAYVNKEIREKLKIPTITYTYETNTNTDNNKIVKEINIKNIKYSLFADLSSIQVKNYCVPWYNEDWLGLKSRGLYHHIGDQVAFIIAANQYGHLYALGETESGDVITLNGLDIARYGVLGNFSWKKNTTLSKNDFDYIYSVPKGSSSIPSAFLTEKSDCKINDLNNYKVEFFWENSIFKKYSLRNNTVGSFEDMVNYILLKVEMWLNKNNKHGSIIEKLIGNKELTENENNVLLGLENNIELINSTSFFYKTLAHKTHCEIINAPKNLDLGFFKKIITSEDKYFDSIEIINKYLVKDNVNFLKFFTEELFNFIVKNFENKNKTKLFKNWKEKNEKAFFISDILNLKNEYRVFVINHRPVATTACFRNSIPLNAWMNGRFDPRLCDGHNAKEAIENRDRVAKYAKFLRKFCSEHKKEYPEYKNYVIDIAYAEDVNDVVPIEINSINWSGAYQVNMFRLCSAIANVPYKYSDMFNNKEYNYFLMRANAWKKMIEDGYIDKETKPPKNGLDRTIKAKTLKRYLTNNYLGSGNLGDYFLDQEYNVYIDNDKEYLNWLNFLENKDETSKN